MRQSCAILAALCGALFLAHCGEETTPAPFVYSMPPAPQQPAATTDAAAPPPGPPAPAAPEPHSAADTALLESLAGTVWQLGDMEVRFLDQARVFVKGGRIRNLSPQGVTIRYHFQEGAITASVAGESITGTWDGQRLTFFGAEAVRAGETPPPAAAQ